MFTKMAVGFATTALLSAGVTVVGVGLATPAQASPSYWHYCPGEWHYTEPVPAGTDLSVCHWFAATSTGTPSGGIVMKLAEVDESPLPDWAKPRPMCGVFPCQGGA